MQSGEKLDSSQVEPEEGSATFLFDIVEIKAPFSSVIAQVETEHGNWLGVTAERSLSSPGLMTRVGPGGILSKKVDIRLGEMRYAMGALLVPIAWMATATPFLFPRLEGDLEFAEFEPGRVRLALRGSYRAPLGSFGEKIDKIFMHKMAESTVRSFLNDVAEELQQRMELG